MENGLVSPSVEGTPQGGPLSPLLSNLVCDELDRELERRGHRFVRYADDCNIYFRSERAGQRVMESTTHFITYKLKLKVNESKSSVARPQERKFLGFSFTVGPDVKRIIAPKALERFKRRAWGITRRAKGVSIETTMKELASYMRGWVGYFGFCETPESAHRPHSLGPAATPGRSVAAVEDTTSSPRGADRTGGERAAGEQYRRQRSWSLGILPGARPSQSDSATSTSDRSEFHLYLARVSATSRTAVYATRTYGGVGGAAA
jgi:Reverse transcriptase (RNA-dependent DNA polymerase)/Group II intron, maturase-specific domain